MNKFRLFPILAAALFLAGCQTVSYVPNQHVAYDKFGRPYTVTTQTPVVVDNTNQVVGAAIVGGVIGLAAGAAISQPRVHHYHYRPYPRHYYRPPVRHYHHHHYYRRW